MVSPLYRLPKVPARRYAGSREANGKTMTVGGEALWLQLSSRH